MIESIQKPLIYFKTFGCRTNLFDTQVMIKNLKSYELCNDEVLANIIVINSCTVTNGADSGVRSYINKIKRKNPDAKIYFTGCGVATQGKMLFEDKKLSGVFGHSQKESIEFLLSKKKRFFEVGDLKYINKTIVTEFAGKSRAFIKIQEGCDFDCSYCIIPSVRGHARSLDEAVILEQIQILAINGFDEFILSGTNVGSYGKDTKSSIAKLLKKISLIKNIKRIRVGSLEPVQIDDEFFELLNESWMAKHLHIALQHTHDLILNKMQRRNKFKDDLILFEKIASYGYALGSDFIVGFPGENDEIWKQTLKRLKELPLTHIHAFTYSKRDNTLASTMNQQVRGDVAKRRLKELNELIKIKNALFKNSINEPLKILIETSKKIDNKFVHTGLDQFFNKVQIVSDILIDRIWIDIDKGNKNIAYL